MGIWLFYNQTFKQPCYVSPVIQSTCDIFQLPGSAGLCPANWLNTCHHHPPRACGFEHPLLYYRSCECPICFLTSRNVLQSLNDRLFCPSGLKLFFKFFSFTLVLGVWKREVVNVCSLFPISLGLLSCSSIAWLFWAPVQQKNHSSFSYVVKMLLPQNHPPSDTWTELILIKAEI